MRDLDRLTEAFDALGVPHRVLTDEQLREGGAFGSVRELAEVMGMPLEIVAAAETAVEIAGDEVDFFFDSTGTHLGHGRADGGLYWLPGGNSDGRTLAGIQQRFGTT